MTRLTLTRLSLLVIVVLTACLASEAVTGPDTIHYQGVGGRCTGTLIACARSVEVSCPFRSMAVAFSEPGPIVCCERFEEALRAPGPRSCDPAGRGDCDYNR